MVITAPPARAAVKIQPMAVVGSPSASRSFLLALFGSAAAHEVQTAPIHRQNRVRDVARFIGRQKDGSFGDLFRPADPAQRNDIVFRLTIAHVLGTDGSSHTAEIRPLVNSNHRRQIRGRLASQPLMAPLDTEYAAPPGLDRSPEPAEILMMLPLPCAFIILPACWMKRK